MGKSALKLNPNDTDCQKKGKKNDSLPPGNLVTPYFTGVVGPISLTYGDYSSLWLSKPIAFWSGDGSSSVIGDE
jgi:hypothetical protein